MYDAVSMWHTRSFVNGTSIVVMTGEDGHDTRMMHVFLVLMQSLKRESIELVCEDVGVGDDDDDDDDYAASTIR